MSDADGGGDGEQWVRALEGFNEQDTEPVIRTLPCSLQTSGRKMERVRECIDEWQAIAQRTAELLPSFPPSEWRLKNSQIYRIIPREFPDRELTAAVAQDAQRKVLGAFLSERAAGCPGDAPMGNFGSASYMRVPAQSVDFEDNGDGFGVRLWLEPHDPEWFRIQAAEYQSRWLARVCDTDDPTTSGGVELHIREGELTLNVPIKTPVAVKEPGTVDRWVGVDIGECNLYALAVVDDRSGEISQVEVKSGREFRHHRTQLQRKHRRLKETDNWRAVERCSGDIERYTEHVLHTASREIVEIAAREPDSGIRLESLGDFNAEFERALGDWPYRKFRDYIEYKAREKEIPVDVIGAWFTSKRCNKCGQLGDRPEGTSEFTCEDCPKWEGDYEVNADVNAAINIARRATSPGPKWGVYQ